MFAKNLNHLLPLCMVAESEPLPGMAGGYRSVTGPPEPPLRTIDEAERRGDIAKARLEVVERQVEALQHLRIAVT